MVKETEENDKKSRRTQGSFSVRRVWSTKEILKRYPGKGKAKVFTAFSSNKIIGKDYFSGVGKRKVKARLK